MAQAGLLYAKADFITKKQCGRNIVFEDNVFIWSTVQAYSSRAWPSSLFNSSSKILEHKTYNVQNNMCNYLVYSSVRIQKSVSTNTTQ
jgi:hypothetical protein